MTTAAQLIDKATGLIGVRAIGQTLSGEVSADCYGYMQMMLDGWRLEPGLSDTVKSPATMVPGQASYELSPTGDVAIQTPQHILGAYVRSGITDYTVEVIPENRYDAISDKSTVSDIPDWIYFDGLTMYVYPVPSVASVMTLTIKEDVPTFSTITTDVPLNAGMESAIASNLALILAPVFEKQPGQLLMMTAANSKRSLKSSNFKPAAVDCPVATGRNFDIVKGDYR